MQQRLSQQMKQKRELNHLCAEAVQQQVKRGEADATHLRNRRRYLAKQVTKRLTLSTRMSARKTLHAATMLLAMWGFVGISMPTTAEAAPLFNQPGIAVNATGPGAIYGAFSDPSLVDIDNDGDLDMFVGHYGAGLKFYRNNGSTAAPDFVADAAGNPLSATTVTLAYTNAGLDFVDIDNDGDMDVFIAPINGAPVFYENTGSATAPLFTAAGATDANGVTAATNALAAVSDGNPSFVDIDNDGDMDLFIGVSNSGAGLNSNGTVAFYENTGSAATALFTAAGGTDANGVTAAANPMAGYNFTGAAKTAFVDIDNDGDMDVFVGSVVLTEVKFYKNTGSATAVNFQPQGGSVINPVIHLVNRFSIAAPAFADIDADGDADFFLGSNSGDIAFFTNTGSAASPKFTTVTTPSPSIDIGKFSTPSLVDIDNDGDLDMFVGHYGAGLKFYRNNGSTAAPDFVADAAGNPLSAATVTLTHTHVGVDFVDIDNDGDMDVFIAPINGAPVFYENTGSATAPLFTAAGATDANGVTAATNALAAVSDGNPSFVDIDNDGDMDLFIGVTNSGAGLGSNGTVAFYENTGSAAAAIFTAAGVKDATGVIAAANPMAGHDVGTSAKASFADIDGDGDLDAFVGSSTGGIFFYENYGGIFYTAGAFVSTGVGTGVKMAFNPLKRINLGGSSAPALVDIDNDGDMDVFIGGFEGTVTFVENFEFDGTAPVITLIGANPITVAQGFIYVDEGSTVTDNVDTGLTATVTGTVNTAIVGTYTLTFNVSDTAGNAAVPVTRTVHVTDQSTLNSPPTSSGGGGGCVVGSETLFHPSMVWMLLAAGLAWFRRRKEG